MKKNLLLIAVISGFVLSGCKYDDGPGISFRSKRDRASNEWKITKFMYNGQDSTATLSNDSLTNILSLNRTGAMSINVAYTDNSKILPANRSSVYKTTIFSARELRFYKLFGGSGSGKWTFINKHKMIEFFPELSENYDYNNTVLRLTIIELRDEKMHLKGFDPDGVEVDIEMEAYNKK